jgi:outer membrane receptor protein involved in Fe transport
LTSIVTNSGDAETKGFEVEALFAPTRFLNGRIGVAYVDAKFTKGCDADEFILNSGGSARISTPAIPTPAGARAVQHRGAPATARIALGSSTAI